MSSSRISKLFDTRTVLSNRTTEPTVFPCFVERTSDFFGCMYSLISKLFEVPFAFRRRSFFGIILFLKVMQSSFFTYLSQRYFEGWLTVPKPANTSCHCQYMQGTSDFVLHSVTKGTASELRFTNLKVSI